MRIFNILLPALLIAYIFAFFSWYFMKRRPREGTLEWIAMRDKPAFTLRRSGKLDKLDIIPISAITLIYAVVALTNLGNTISPESFRHFSREDPSVTLELSSPAQIDTVFYFTGLYHAGKDKDDNPLGYKLEFSPDGENWTAQPKMSQQYSETFRWLYAALSPEQPDNTMFIRISAQAFPLELGELVIVGKAPDGTRRTISSNTMTSEQDIYALFDEQTKVPQRYEVMNSTHFDEIYHARTAYEHYTGEFPYEITHPPLGKLLTSVGIALFGMTPFGWRFMPTLFGILMVPLIYILLRWMFSRRLVAICATALFSFDFMHFVQTRISTIDVYGVFFILLMYLFMYRYITSGLDTPLRKTLPPLFLAGLAFGLGAASKWICIYAGIGLAVMYAVYLVQRAKHAHRQEQRFAPFLWGTLGFSVLFFVVIPGAIYYASYLPYPLAKYPELNEVFKSFAGFKANIARLLERAWDECYRNQIYMLKYHGKDVLGSKHDYAARWYQWIFDVKPILYYITSYDINGVASRGSLWSFTNPLVTWAGIPAIILCAVDTFRRRSSVALFIIVGYLSQLLPWVAIERLTFPYHYFPSMVFLVLALGYVFESALEREPEKGRKHIIIFTAVGVLIFAMFYPVLTGTMVPEWYPSIFLRWIPATWLF